MKHVIAAMAAVAALLAVSVTPAPAQAPVPGRSPAIPAPGERQVEGTVERVDPAGRTVQVAPGGLLGLLGLGRTSLEVNEATRVRVAGREDSLAGIREGARVRASYELRDGKYVATSVDVMHAEGAGPRPAPAVPPGAVTPADDQPKTSP